MSAALPVLAAGALCWREVDGEILILLVRRTQHKDVSLPKGKLDPGETLPETAVREIAEETGLSISLGAPLGEVDYVLPNGRDKVVFYWSAEVSEHAVAASRFTPNDEIESLEWVSVAEARATLSYRHDLDIVETFVGRVATRTARTFALIALRHAKTVPPDSWDGPDATRPLLQRGVDQAASIAQGLAAYRPTKIISSTATRCLSTVAPVARITGVEVRETANLSQDAHEWGKADVVKVITRRLAKRKTALLCSHGPVLPDIIDEIAHLTNTPITSELRRAAMLSPGQYSVLHIALDSSEPTIVAIETHSPSAS